MRTGSWSAAVVVIIIGRNVALRSLRDGVSSHVGAGLGGDLAQLLAEPVKKRGVTVEPASVVDATTRDALRLPGFGSWGAVNRRVTSRQKVDHVLPD